MGVTDVVTQLILMAAVGALLFLLVTGAALLLWVIGLGVWSLFKEFDR
jgi:hypothetical protein